LLGETNERVEMRLLAYCLLSNHFHLVVWPREDGDLSRGMQWLLTANVRRYHRHYKTSGHVWQAILPRQCRGSKWIAAPAISRVEMKRIGVSGA